MNLCYYFVILQIVAMYAFNKTKYAADPECDIDFETMRLVVFFSQDNISRC